MYDVNRHHTGRDGTWVFRGDYLPKDLDRLFEGVHFNAGISDGYMKLTGDMTPESLIFGATAADYAWNPRGWSAAGSWRRAKRFVEVMTPLLKSPIPVDDGAR